MREIIEHYKSRIGERPVWPTCALRTIPLTGRRPSLAMLEAKPSRVPLPRTMESNIYDRYKGPVPSM